MGISRKNDRRDFGADRFSIRLILLALVSGLAGVLSSMAGVWLSSSFKTVLHVLSQAGTLLFLGVGLCVAVGLAGMFALRMSGQLHHLTQCVKSLSGPTNPLHQVRLSHDLQPVYDAILEHQEFQKHVTDVIHNSLKKPDSHDLSIPSAENEFFDALNTLLHRFHSLQHGLAKIKRGDLSLLDSGTLAEAGVLSPLYSVLSELRESVSRARTSTNQIVRTSSRINSLAVQGVQDTKNAVQQLHGISEAMQTLLTDMNTSLEPLHKQSALLNNAMTSTEQRLRSIDDISGQLLYVRTQFEHNPSCAELIRKGAGSLGSLRSTSRQIQSNAKEALTVSHTTLDKAEEGKTLLSQTISSIQEIQEAMHAFFEMLTRLDERSEEVSDVLRVIRDIADHTNLLAINAAIISAHAGEHGRDFGIIAEQIGKFAERTQESAEEIEDLLDTIQTEFGGAGQTLKHSSRAVSSASRFSQQAGILFKKVTSSLEQIYHAIVTIEASSSQQISDIQSTWEKMEGMIHERTEQLEEIEHALGQLIETGEHMRDMITAQSVSNAQSVEAVKTLEQLLARITTTASQHTAAAARMIQTLDTTRSVIRRVITGAEKTTALTDELFSQAGNAACTMGEFPLTAQTPAARALPNRPFIGFLRRGPDQFFNDIAGGIRERAQEHNIDILEFNAQYAPTAQIDQINLILKHPFLKGIILCPTEKYIAQKLVHKINIQKIPVIAADEAVPNTLSVRSSSRKGGRLAADLFLNQIESGQSIAVIVDRTVESMVQRGLGFRQNAEKHGFDVIERYCDMSQREEVRHDLLAALHEQHDVQGIFLPNEAVTTEYLQALRAGVLPPQTLAAVGYDYTPLAENAIRKGELLGIIFQNPSEIGRQAFDSVYDLINQNIHLDDFSEKTIYIPITQITRATLENLPK